MALYRQLGTLALRDFCQQQGWLAAFQAMGASAIVVRPTRFADLQARHRL